MKWQIPSLFQDFSTLHSNHPSNSATQDVRWYLTTLTAECSSTENWYCQGDTTIRQTCGNPQYISVPNKVQWKDVIHHLRPKAHYFIFQNRRQLYPNVVLFRKPLINKTMPLLPCNGPHQEQGDSVKMTTWDTTGCAYLSMRQSLDIMSRGWLPSINLKPWQSNSVSNINELKYQNFISRTEFACLQRNICFDPNHQTMNFLFLSCCMNVKVAQGKLVIVSGTSCNASCVRTLTRQVRIGRYRDPLIFNNTKIEDKCRQLIDHRFKFEIVSIDKIMSFSRHLAQNRNNKIRQIYAHLLHSDLLYICSVSTLITRSFSHFCCPYT